MGADCPIVEIAKGGLNAAQTRNTGMRAMAVCLGVVLSIAAVKLVYGHDNAAWIQRGGYKNAVGELCCGPRDCAELTDADVKVTPAGYYVVSTKETVPFHEATPSPTGTYWRCFWGGSRKCFFAPPGSS
jgi:hypothetical protein